MQSTCIGVPCSKFGARPCQMKGKSGQQSNELGKSGGGRSQQNFQSWVARKTWSLQQSMEEEMVVCCHYPFHTEVKPAAIIAVQTRSARARARGGGGGGGFTVDAGFCRVRFVLKESQLEYYKAPTSADPQGVVLIAEGSSRIADTPGSKGSYTAQLEVPEPPPPQIHTHTQNTHQQSPLQTPLCKLRNRSSSL